MVELALFPGEACSANDVDSVPKYTCQPSDAIKIGMLSVSHRLYSM